MWVYRHPEELYGKGSAQSGWTKASLVVPLGVAPADLLSGRHRTVRAQVYLAHSSDGEGKEGSRHAEAGWAVMETPFEAGPRHRRSPRTRPVGLFLQTSSQCPDSLPSPSYSVPGAGSPSHNHCLQLSPLFSENKGSYCIPSNSTVPFTKDLDLPTPTTVQSLQRRPV